MRPGRVVLGPNDQRLCCDRGEPRRRQGIPPVHRRLGGGQDAGHRSAQLGLLIDPEADVDHLVGQRGLVRDHRLDPGPGVFPVVAEDRLVGGLGEQGTEFLDWHVRIAHVDDQGQPLNPFGMLSGEERSRPAALREAQDVSLLGTDRVQIADNVRRQPADGVIAAGLAGEAVGEHVDRVDVEFGTQGLHDRDVGLEVPADPVQQNQRRAAAGVQDPGPHPVNINEAQFVRYGHQVFPERHGVLLLLSAGPGANRGYGWHPGQGGSDSCRASARFVISRSASWICLAVASTLKSGLSTIRSAPSSVNQRA